MVRFTPNLLLKICLWFLMSFVFILSLTLDFYGFVIVSRSSFEPWLVILKFGNKVVSGKLPFWYLSWRLKFLFLLSFISLCSCCLWQPNPCWNTLGTLNANLDHVTCWVVVLVSLESLRKKLVLCWFFLLFWKLFLSCFKKEDFIIWFCLCLNKWSREEGKEESLFSLMVLV